MLAIIAALLIQFQVATPADDVVGGPLETIREWMETREKTEDTRYHGMRSILEQIRDRPQQADASIVFPRISEAIQEIRQSRIESAKTVGPIREAIQMLTQLVSALILLAGVLLVVDVYRTFFRSKA